MTFTADKDEMSPTWSMDGSFFVFASNRDAPNNGSQRQLYLMRPDGGEARKLTSAKDGVSDFAFSRDGRWLVYRAGKSGEQQLYRLPVAAIAQATTEVEPEQLTKQPWPRRAHRQANRDLLSSRRRSRREQAREIRAGDEQHHRRHAGQHDQRLGEPPSERRETATGVAQKDLRVL